MKTLEDFTFSNQKKSKYDWNTIFNGGTYELINQEDFKCDVKSFRIYVLKIAKSRNINVKTQISGKNLIVKAQISENKNENST